MGAVGAPGTLNSIIVIECYRDVMRRHNLRNREISRFDTLCPMHHTAHVFSIVFLRRYIYLLHDLA